MSHPSQTPQPRDGEQQPSGEQLPPPWFDPKRGDYQGYQGYHGAPGGGYGYGGQPINPSTGQPYPPQGWGPPPAPPKKKHRIRNALLVLLGLFVLIGACSALAGGGDPSTSDSSSSTSEQQEPSAGLGQAVVSGDLEFTVHGSECGIPRVGGAQFGEEAQGQFCKLDVTVTNVGDEGAYFTSSDAKLTNAEGQTFEASSTAALYDQNSESIFEQINPGNSLSSSLYFDVPADMLPLAVELRGGIIATPAVVSLV